MNRGIQFGNETIDNTKRWIIQIVRLRLGRPWRKCSDFRSGSLKVRKFTDYLLSFPDQQDMDAILPAGGSEPENVYPADVNWAPGARGNVQLGSVYTFAVDVESKFQEAIGPGTVT